MNIAGLKTGVVGLTETVVERHGIEMGVIAPEGMRSTDAVLIQAVCYSLSCLRMNGGATEVNHTTARVIHQGLGGDG